MTCFGPLPISFLYFISAVFIKMCNILKEVVKMTLKHTLNKYFQIGISPNKAVFDKWKLSADIFAIFYEPWPKKKKKN